MSEPANLYPGSETVETTTQDAPSARPACHDLEWARQLIRTMGEPITGRRISSFDMLPQSPCYAVPEAGEKWNSWSPENCSRLSREERSLEWVIQHARIYPYSMIEHEIEEAARNLDERRNRWWKLFRAMLENETRIPTAQAASQSTQSQPR